MISQLPSVFIKATHHEPESGDLTGLGFTIKFGLATAVVSIQDTRLRRAVSDLTLEKLILKEAASGNF